MRVQHGSEVRTDIVLVQIEVNDVVLLQLLHLCRRACSSEDMLPPLPLASIPVPAPSMPSPALVVAGVLVRRTCRDCHNRQSDHQPFQHFVQLHFFGDSFNNQLFIITDTATRQAIFTCPSVAGRRALKRPSVETRFSTDPIPEKSCDYHSAVRCQTWRFV